MERFSVTQLAHGDRYERKGKLVPSVFYVHKETTGAYRCSMDGIPLVGEFPIGVLPKKAIIEHGKRGPFLIASVRSRLLIERKLIGSLRLSADREWSDEDRNHLMLAELEQGAERKRISDSQKGRGQMLTSFGRNEYA